MHGRFSAAVRVLVVIFVEQDRGERLAHFPLDDSHLKVLTHFEAVQGAVTSTWIASRLRNGRLER